MRDRAEQQHAPAHQFGDAGAHVIDGDDQRAYFRRAGGLHQRARRVAGEFAKRLAERAQRPRLAAMAMTAAMPISEPSMPTPNPGGQPNRRRPIEPSASNTR